MPYVAGGSCDTSARTSLARGALLARLHAELLPLRDRLGQRPSWRMQPDLTTRGSNPPASRDWTRSDRRTALSPKRSSAPMRPAAASCGLGLEALPTFLLHGDFTTSNVRQQRGSPCGVIDFDLCHVGSRPWELAIARLQRAPEMLDGYRSEAARLGIPLSAQEEAALPAIYRAFRVGMIGWALADGARLGSPDRDFIRGQLQRLHVPVRVAWYSQP